MLDFGDVGGVEGEVAEVVPGSAVNKSPEAAGVIAKIL